MTTTNAFLRMVENWTCTTIKELCKLPALATATLIYVLFVLQPQMNDSIVFPSQRWLDEHPWEQLA